MPVALKRSQLKYKNPETGTYVGVDAVAEKTTAEMIAEVESAGQAKLSAINARATEVQASLPKVEEMEDIVAVPFVQSESYPEGAYVIYAVNGVNHLYKLPDGHTAGVAWGEFTAIGPLTFSEELNYTIKDIVAIQDERPEAIENKIWMTETPPEPIVVPTYDDFDDFVHGVTQQIDDIREDVDILNGGGLEIKDEVITSSITDWLEDHPEATTTVQDGSITKAKLNSNLSGEIDDKASVIIDGTEKAEEHANIHDVRSIAFYKNDHAFTDARYINSKNYLPNANTTWTDSGVTMNADGHFVTYNGTAVSRTVKFVIDKATLDEPMEAGDYKFRIELQERMSSYTGFELLLTYESDPTSRTSVVSQYIGNTDTVYEYDFTAAERVVKISYKVGTVPNETYENYKMWFGVFDADAQIVDTGLPVSSEDPVIYSDENIGSLASINTMQHESIINYTADTKTYVDTHIPDIIGYWNDRIYALPEDFGAVGDGVADDAQALMDCIAYSASSGKPVRGYGKYKTSSTLLINARHQDVYIKHLVYTGDDTAFKISDRFINLSFETIESSNIGITFERYNGQNCSHHKVSGVRIYSVGDCIRAKDESYYVSIDVRHMESTTGNCINSDYTADSKNSAEYVIRDCSFRCAVGWVAYRPFGYKFYGCTVERDCQNGYYNPINCSFFGCRHREFVDATLKRIWEGQTSITNGPLFKFVTSPSYKGTHGNKYFTADTIPWHSIDVSEISGYDEIEYTSSEDIDQWRSMAYNGQGLGITIRNDYARYDEIIGSECYFIGNNKVFVPDKRMNCVLSQAQYDMTLFESHTDADILAAYNQGGWGTDFITGYAHTDYYMNASFGAIGYNDITIEQVDGKTCTFYDKLGNVIFDGTNKGDGKWRLKCTIDRSSTGRLLNPPSYLPGLWWCYDGTNEKWETEILSSESNFQSMIDDYYGL